MKKYFVILAAVGSVMGLSGCSEQVNNDVILEEITGGIPENQGVLRVQTRSETSPQEGMVYVFDSKGTCVKVLSTDEGGQLAATQLPVGTYSAYAIGGDDLSVYTLPDLEGAAASSVISVAEGKVMGDLLMKTATVTLTAGNASNLALELERQVLQLKEVTIKQVPTDVTKVEVSIAPLYQGIMLDGTFTEEHSTLQLELTKKSDNDTWTNGTNQPYCFPSDGEPTITVSFTRTSGVKRYSYQASEALEANHQVVLEGTYSEEQDALLSGTLTARAWEAEKNMPFEFNEENLVDGDSSENPEEHEVPVVGSTYQGYYVVSVDVASNRAVLLSKTQVDGFTDEGAVNAALSTWTAPEDVSGTWRFGTLEEMTAFLNDRNVNNLEKGERISYYCKDENTIKWVELFFDNAGTYHVNNQQRYTSQTWLRPVIDITY